MCAISHVEQAQGLVKKTEKELVSNERSECSDWNNGTWSSPVCSAQHIAGIDYGTWPNRTVYSFSNLNYELEISNFSWAALLTCTTKRRPFTSLVEIRTQFKMPNFRGLCLLMKWNLLIVRSQKLDRFSHYRNLPRKSTKIVDLFT